MIAAWSNGRASIYRIIQPLSINKQLRLRAPHRLEITTHILGYQEDNVIGDEAQFIPLIAIRHVDYQTN